jgi:hypothetical protein
MRIRTRLAAMDVTPEMSQTCDRCGPAVPAVYHARRDGELYLCRHCADRYRPALSAQGWIVQPVDERTSSRY